MAQLSSPKNENRNPLATSAPQITSASKKSAAGKDRILLRRLGGYDALVESPATLRILKQAEIDGSTMIIGFADSTLIPPKVCKFLVEALELPLAGVITSTLFSPGMTLVDGGEIVYPIRIYGNSAFSVVVSELVFQEAHVAVLDSVLKLLVGLAVKRRVPHIVSLSSGGEVPPREKPRSSEEKRARKESVKSFCGQRTEFATSSEALAERLLSLGHRAISRLVLPGLSGALLKESQFFTAEAPDVTVMASFSERFDGWGAVCALSALSEALEDLEVDLSSFRPGEDVADKFFEQRELKHGDEAKEARDRLYV